MLPDPASQHKPPCKPLCAGLWPSCHPGQQPPTAQVKTPLWAICDRTWTGGVQRNRPSGHGEYGGRRKSRIKTWRPGCPQLPAVRAVCGGTGWGQRWREKWHLGSRSTQTPSSQCLWTVSWGRGRKEWLYFTGSSEIEPPKTKNRVPLSAIENLRIF